MLFPTPHEHANVRTRGLRQGAAPSRHCPTCYGWRGQEAVDLALLKHAVLQEGEDFLASVLLLHL